MNIDGLIQGVEGQMKVTHGKKGNEHRWKKWQGSRGPRGINLARGGTYEGGNQTSRGASAKGRGNRTALQILEACSCAKSNA